MLTMVTVQRVQSRIAPEDTLSTMLDQMIEGYKASLGGYGSLQIESLSFLVVEPDPGYQFHGKSTKHTSTVPTALH